MCVYIYAYRMYMHHILHPESVTPPTTKKKKKNTAPPDDPKFRGPGCSQRDASTAELLGAVQLLCGFRTV